MNNQYKCNDSRRAGLQCSRRIALMAFCIITLILISGFVHAPDKSKSNFASYDDVRIDVIPCVPEYTIEADLSNVMISEELSLTQEIKDKLVQNGFAVTRWGQFEFFPTYEYNRYEYIPNFVTVDSILHNYHMLFDHLLRKLEEKELANELHDLSTLMLDSSYAQYQSLKGTQWENAAKRNVAFFSVGLKIIAPLTPIPDVVSEIVNEEIELIESHKGFAISPAMNTGFEIDGNAKYKEDYSQYIPRGHYDKSEQLKSYFKAMMWYGRMTFGMSDEDKLKSAVLMTCALDYDKNSKSWDTIYEPITFFVGCSDDITYRQLGKVVQDVYGDNPDLKSLTIDEDKFVELMEAVKKLEPPQINSIPITAIVPQSEREKIIKGFRFMGQRYTIDAAIFQNLIDPKVSGRMLPKGLDIAAVMGSDEAYKILDSMGETDYPNYSEQIKSLKDSVDSLSLDTWTQNLYWSWMYTLLPLLEEKSDGYPLFMKNKAWTRKELTTYLASWTELKHDTILYAKQSGAEGGDGPDYDEVDDRGYIEPNPLLYTRLASMLKMTKEGLESRGLLNDTDKEHIDKTELIITYLKTISEKELGNIPRTDDEYEFIRSYGLQLEHLWYEINKKEMAELGIDCGDFLQRNTAAIVADVSTSPFGQVLEEATNVYTIYVVVPIEDKLRVARGTVFGYYEFPWDQSDRLTDDDWRSILQGWGGKWEENTPAIPARPSWTEIYFANKIKQE